MAKIHEEDKHWKYYCPLSTDSITIIIKAQAGER